MRMKRLVKAMPFVLIRCLLYYMPLLLEHLKQDRLAYTYTYACWLFLFFPEISLLSLLGTMFVGIDPSGLPIDLGGILVACDSYLFYAIWTTLWARYVSRDKNME